MEFNPKTYQMRQNQRATYLLLIMCAFFSYVSCMAQTISNDSTYFQDAPWHKEILQASTYPKGWASIASGGDSISFLRADASIHYCPYKSYEDKLLDEKKPYETGKGTYYSSRTHGRLMADGTRYDKTQLFCAHKKLPFGTKLKVVNKKNNKSVIVIVRDRGPFGKGLIVDLSNRAASELDMISDGVVPVELYVIDK